MTPARLRSTPRPRGAGVLATSAYLVPAVQASLESHFASEEAIQRFRSLLLATGSALIRAAAIVTSLVLFAMQVNVECMPHGLFRRLSGDRKLLGAFALSFLLAIGTATMSIVIEAPRFALLLVSEAWAIVFILSLFLYAYRRALRLINPLAQLQILLDDTRAGLRRWSRMTVRVRPLLESAEDAPAPSPRGYPEADAALIAFFRTNAHWADDLHRPTKELLLNAIAARSHVTIHMFQWIQGFTGLLLAVSNARACEGNIQNELRSHARRLIAALDWIPSDEDSVTFVENYQLTETLFESSVDARERGCDENAEEIARLLLSWTFKGGRYITG